MKLIFWIRSSRGTDQCCMKLYPYHSDQLAEQKEIKEELDYWCSHFGAWHVSENHVSYGVKEINQDGAGHCFHCDEIAIMKCISNEMLFNGLIENKVYMCGNCYRTINIPDYNLIKGTISRSEMERLLGIRIKEIEHRKCSGCSQCKFKGIDENNHFKYVCISANERRLTMNQFNSRIPDWCPFDK